MGLIVWSPEATSDFEGIVDYLFEVWGEGSVLDFSVEVDRILKIISERPGLFPIDDTGQLHKAVIVKQITLLYSVNGGTVELIRFWDTRQNPNKLKI